jgi:thioesterase domain-containing protein
MLARPMGVIVESANDLSLVLRAPLAPNANHKGTAFGGSLYSLAVLTGWAWLTRFLATRRLDAEAVIQESSMRFLKPVHGEMRACLEIPAAADIDKFQKMLVRADRGRIRLQVKMHEGSALATIFDGLFAAAMRR